MTLRSSSGSQHCCNLQFRWKRRRSGGEEGVHESEGGARRGEMREEADGWNKRQERNDDGLKEMSNEDLPQVKFWLKYKQRRFINAGEMVVR